MSDRLLRESDVMKAIDKRIKELLNDSEFVRKNRHIDVLGVKRHISAIPSADRPQGKWIHNPNGIDRDFIWWKCSNCGNEIFSETEYDREKFHAFCGRCGAKME